MRSAYVLYLNDDIAAPSLELLRRICQPKSRSLPHVTVRYPVSTSEAANLSVYESASVGHIVLNGPGSFSISPEGGGEVKPYPKTVFLRCDSDELESLVYKPDFPDSVFHITIYDGVPNPFSAMVLSLLAEFRWNLNVDLPASTGLTRISIGPRARVKHPHIPFLSSDALALLNNLPSAPATAELLVDLPDEARLALVKEVCTLLHERLLAIPRPRSRVAETSAIAHLYNHHSYEQPRLWDDTDDLGLRLSVGPTPNRQRIDFARSISLFLTPPEVARDMVMAALDLHGSDRPIDFGDPAIGNGIFFATLLKMAPRQIMSAVGVEVDARRAHALSVRWSEYALKVFTGNFVEDHPREPRSLILANPPYLRFQRLDSAATERWRRHLGSSLNLVVDGRSDLFVYFVLSCHKWMAGDAIAAWLIPIEFMEAQYGASLRKYFTTNVEMARIHLYDQRTSQFENSKVSSAVVLIRNRAPTEDHTVIVSHGGSLSSPDTVATVRCSDLRDRRRWNFASGPNGVSDAARSDVEEGDCLGDLFRIRRGIATGANKLFVISHAVRRELAIPNAWVKPVVPRSRSLRSNIVFSGKSGDPVGVERLWLIDTDASLAEIGRRTPRLRAYLERVEEAVGDRKLVRSRRPFYQQEQIPPPPFFFSYMARSDSSRLPSRFFLNCSRAVILNSYLGLYPRGELQQRLDSGAISHEQVFEVLLGIERSELLAEARHYAAGLAKVEPGELKRVKVDNGWRSLLG